MVAPKRLLPTTVVGSYPQPDWLVDRALLSGTLLRPLPGASLIGPTLWLYAPFKNIPYLIRLNQQSLGVPAAYAAEFTQDTRQATTRALTNILKSKGVAVVALRSKRISTASTAD